jgi:sugar lactone lactonase YvrE
VVPPDGKLINRVHLAERCAKLCFGGETHRLFMAAGHSIYAHYDNTQEVPVPKP